MLRSLRQELEEQDVPQDVQHLLQQVQLRAAGDRAGHAQPLPLLRHHGQSKNRQAQVPLGRRQAAITDVSDLETSFNSPCHVCSLQ
jgi:hypothetical protein